jgi:hypothetical protein
MNESKADDLLLRKAAYEDFMTSNQAAAAEQSILLEPNDLVLRARLLLYYCQRSWSSSSEQIEVAKARLNHILWFVEQFPDCKFCGERLFYLNSAEYGYEELKKLWLAQISHSSNLMRRVSAYMLFAYNDDPKLPRYFQQFFARSENNIWIHAIAELFETKQTWFLETLHAESAKSMPNNRIINELTSRADSEKLARVASEQRITTIDEFERTLRLFEGSPEGLDKLAMLLGYTWYRYELFSPLHFDPEFTALRFVLACWVLRHIPGSRLAESPIVWAPFFDLENVDHLYELSEFLVDILCLQVEGRPEDLPLAKNAAYFVRGIEYASPALAERLSTKLRLTTDGRNALKTAKRRIT